MKGLSSIVVLVLLLVVSVALVGAFAVFSQRFTAGLGGQAEQQAQTLREQFSNPKIESVKDQEILVRNLGSSNLSADTLAVFIEGGLANHTASFDAIQPNRIGSVTIHNLWEFGRGEHTLRVSSGVFEDTEEIEIEPAEGRALDLRLDEGSGTSASDSSGSGNAGTLVNGPTWTSGKFGKALSFDGSNDYVDCGSSASVRPAAFTVAAWIKTSDTGSNILFSWASVESPPVVGPWDGNQLIVYAGNDNYRTFTAAGVTNNEWHHTVYTIPGSAQTDVANSKAYVDGRALATANTVITGTPAAKTSCRVAGTGPGSWVYGGLVDELLIYGRVLTPDQLYIMRLA